MIDPRQRHSGRPRQGLDSRPLAAAVQTFPDGNETWHTIKPVAPVMTKVAVNPLTVLTAPGAGFTPVLCCTYALDA
jgi:hypothetical protein